MTDFEKKCDAALGALFPLAVAFVVICGIYNAFKGA
jgi:hypothetical protein